MVAHVLILPQELPSHVLILPQELPPQSQQELQPEQWAVFGWAAAAWCIVFLHQCRYMAQCCPYLKQQEQSFLGADDGNTRWSSQALWETRIRDRHRRQPLLSPLVIDPIRRKMMSNLDPWGWNNGSRKTQCGWWNRQYGRRRHFHCLGVAVSMLASCTSSGPFHSLHLLINTVQHQLVAMYVLISVSGFALLFCQSRMSNRLISVDHRSWTILPSLYTWLLL